MRVFKPDKIMKWLLYGGVGVCLTFYIGDFLWVIFECDPIAGAWNPMIKSTCHKEFVPGSSSGIFNLMSDLYILILPIPMVMRLHTTTKRKIRLFAIFSVGTFAVVASIVRLAETIIQNKNPDSTYTVGRLSIWA